MRQPVLLRLKLKNGQIRQGVQIDRQAPQIDGFLSVVSNEYNSATKYISLDSIEWFIVSNEEANSARFAFERRVKVKVEENY